MEEIKMLEAHDSEVLCLEYTRPQTGTKIKSFSASSKTSHCCLYHKMPSETRLLNPRTLCYPQALGC